MLLEGLAVVGQEDDRRVLGKAVLLERCEHPADVTIREGDLAPVALVLGLRPVEPPARVVHVGHVRVEEVHPC